MKRNEEHLVAQDNQVTEGKVISKLQELRDYLAAVPPDQAERARTIIIGELDALIPALSVPEAHPKEEQDSGLKDALDLSTRSGQIALELLRNARCPECDGSGAIQVQTGSREYVTRDMARDAGDLSMEGSLYRDEEWETQECEWCSQRAMILSEHAPKSDSGSEYPQIPLVEDKEGEKEHRALP